MTTSLARLTSRRVVITGVGVVSPLAADAESSWKRMINSESGIVAMPDFPWKERSVAKIGGFVPRDGEYAFDPLKYIDGKDLRRMSVFIHYAIAAACQALTDSGILSSDGVIDSRIDTSRTGVFIGSGIGGMEVLDASIVRINETGKSSPMFIPSVLINIAAGNIAIKHQFGGQIAAHCSACASGLQSIAEAARAVVLGDADVMVAGGCESVMCQSSFAGFHGCRALSIGFNDAPDKASRPWDNSRDGFVMSEGAGIVILEEYEHAKKRNAPIYGEVVGSGVRSDHYHVTAPHPEGFGARNSMGDALKSAEMDPDDIDYIKAHATSTPVGDNIELLAMHKVFGSRSKKRLYASSMKSALGHTLGASGGIETALALLALRDGVLPPTLNLEDPEDSYGIDLVPLIAKEVKIKALMSNAFGFGGVNVSVIVKAI